MRHFLIDTDTASDDAVALVMALTYPDVQTEAITVVSGNVHVDQAVQNALYTVELCGRPIPVYRGAEKPVLRSLETAEYVHGRDGMGDIGLPLCGRIPAEGHGVTKIIETINRFPGNITLVTLGPLTNIALAILQDSSIAGKVKECIIMGGTGQGRGNVTPVAEYNIWVDPEAARIVFESSLPITMVGWDASLAYAMFNTHEMEKLRSVETPLAEFCVDIQKALRKFSVKEMNLEGFDLPDPLAMAVALDPTVATETKPLFVAIETESQLCREQTVVDHLAVTKQEPNVNVVLKASREKFLRILYDAVR
ncbi:inosine/uridine-preferring nucleoside hydrolase [Candidatus Scalindua japonica]|uniref:Inosine/uridine-preferring nucleoside hydrolase n=1 Tax=Candidatus Scalindua japonica TaxID=1284222 RepID=A0A286U1H6_9BACT|nr:nucleoside hydrolase [Candidatus Scalindua japonica]GAX61998.1 inosine/uridine-preferring nucleoside hydrolase [Candidatus Scalindua japonica]